MDQLIALFRILLHRSGRFLLLLCAAIGFSWMMLVFTHGNNARIPLQTLWILPVFCAHLGFTIALRRRLEGLLSFAAQHCLPGLPRAVAKAWIGGHVGAAVVASGVALWLDVEPIVVAGSVVFAWGFGLAGTLIAVIGLLLMILRAVMRFLGLDLELELLALGGVGLVLAAAVGFGGMLRTSLRLLAHGRYVPTDARASTAAPPSADAVIAESDPDARTDSDVDAFDEFYDAIEPTLNAEDARDELTAKAAEREDVPTRELASDWLLSRLIPTTWVAPRAVALLVVAPLAAALIASAVQPRVPPLFWPSILAIATILVSVWRGVASIALVRNGRAERELFALLPRAPAAGALRKHWRDQLAGVFVPSAFALVGGGVLLALHASVPWRDAVTFAAAAGLAHLVAALMCIQWLGCVLVSADRWPRSTGAAVLGELATAPFGAAAVSALVAGDGNASTWTIALAAAAHVIAISGFAFRGWTFAHLNEVLRGQPRRNSI